MRKFHRFLLLVALILASCARSSHTAVRATSASVVEATKFRRANATPLAVSAIYYNDAAGLTTMAGPREPRRTWATLAGPAGALVAVGLRGESGQFLPGLLLGNRWFV